MPSADRDARTTVKELLSFIEKQGQADYMGEAVSQLEHSLQAATLAENAGADHETILGALLHDVGRFIPAAEKMENMITADGTYIGKASHEILGERYLRQLGFSEKVCQVVGAHVVAKRYLCAVEKGYWESLSKSSKQTLEFQVCSRLPGFFTWLSDKCRAVFSPRKKSQRRSRMRGWSRSSRCGGGTIRRRTPIGRHCLSNISRR